MKFKSVLGAILLPFKFLFELLDPMIRYVEMAVYVLLEWIVGVVVDLITAIPPIKFIATGELLLAILSATLSVVCIDAISSLNWALKILIFLAITAVAYFILYFVIRFVTNFITSAISLIFVLIRLGLYMPNTICETVVKVILSASASVAIFFINKSFWIVNANNLIIYLLICLSVLCVISIIMLLCKRNIRIKSMGILADVDKEDLTSFNKSIGLYIMTLGVMPVYIGRAIEFNNGGFRKRIRDYIRDSSSARKHTSGRLINKNKDQLYLYIIEMGHREEDVDTVKEAERSMISSIYTAFNSVDKQMNYIISIIGYVLAAVICTIITFTNTNKIVGLICLGFYVFVAIVSIVKYFNQKR